MWTTRMKPRAQVAYRVLNSGALSCLILVSSALGIVNARPLDAASSPAAKSAAAHAPALPALPKACARNLDTVLVNTVLASSDAEAVKATELRLLLQSTAVAGWSATPRPKDLTAVLDIVIKAVLAKGGDSSAVAASLTKALNSACAVGATADSADILAAALAAAGVVAVNPAVGAGAVPPKADASAPVAAASTPPPAVAPAAPKQPPAAPQIPAVGGDKPAVPVIAAAPPPAAPAAAPAPVVGGGAAGAQTSKAATLNDLTNYQGDRMNFPSDMIVQLEGPDQSVVKTVCLPRRWVLIGQNSYTANGNAASNPAPGAAAGDAAGGNKATGAGGSTPETGTRFLIAGPSWRTLKNLLKGESSDDHSPKTCNPQWLKANVPVPSDPDGWPAAYEHAAVRVTSQQMAAVPPNRYGLTYGVLSVPFKYQLSGAHGITGSASIGPYMGWRMDQETIGVALALVGFAGASNISVPASATPSSSASNGSTPSAPASSTESLFGLSYGLGVVGTVKGNFQLGVVLGADHVSSSAKYEYNDKPWIAAELGYSFLQ